MELPDNIKTLYKHWDKHTRKPVQFQSVVLNQAVLNDIVNVVNKRIHIYEKRESGDKKPYTDDQILATYRFCNIYRELDRQTIYYHTLLKPLEKDFVLWFLNMLFCRSICRTETIERIGLLSFDEGNNAKVYDKLMKMDSPKYGNAYVFPISVIQKTKWNTREKFFCEYYPTIINKVAERITKFEELSVVEALKEILPTFGFNLKFLLTELLIDVAYQYPTYIDLFKQFPIGPGSLPTMKMLNKIADPEVTNISLVGSIRFDIDYVTFQGNPVYLSAENWEGIGCEFRKYCNLKVGNGRKRFFR